MDFKSNIVKYSCYLIILIAIIIKISIIYKPYFVQFDETLSLTNKLNYYSKIEKYNIFFSGNNECSKKASINRENKVIKLPIFNSFCKKITFKTSDINENIFLYSLKMSFNVNYAPINFFFFNLFIENTSNFEKKLFNSKISFLFFSILSVFLLFKILSKIFTEKETLILLLSLASFSHMINSYELQSIPWG